jgi:hypothetical protein
MKRRSLMVLAALVFSAAPVVVGQSPVAAAGTCMEDGTNCKVGDVGPRGGIVYYDAGSMQWWGRFLEAKTTSTPAEGIWGIAGAIGGVSSVATKQLGMGWSNSLFMNVDSSSVVRRLAGSAFSDGFYLPSKDELDALYNYWKISGDKNLKYSAAPMWSSTEASATFAWYQLFQDGTQFTDANGIIKDPKTTKAITQNKAFLKSPKHTGSDFEPTPFQVIGVRSFPRLGTIPYGSDLVVATTSNDKCSNGGAATVCNIGDIGPGGGIVFYDAGKEEYWGRYLEIAPKSCEGERYPWRPADNKKTVYTAQGDQTAAELRVLAKGIGMGKVNTRIITLALGGGKYAAKYAEDLECNGRDDWFLPSKDELDTAYNRLAQNRVGSKDTPIGGFNKGYYWTSTDYNDKTAWSQYFMDGQQFDRVQTMDGNRKPPTPFRVRAIRAFGTNSVALTCAQGGTCKIGDTGPEGGKVFYVAPDLLVVNGKSWRYLEAWHYDIEGSLCSIDSCDKAHLHLRLPNRIGAGSSNTKALMRLINPNDEIRRMINFGNATKANWFIPSLSELIELLEQREIVGDITTQGSYWSSSPNGDMVASVGINRGVIFERKSQSLNVRLIRAFG